MKLLLKTMAFTPRDRAISFLEDLQKFFADWMDEYEEFLDLKDEAESLFKDVKEGESDELEESEQTRLDEVTSELVRWAEELQDLNSRRSFSRNNLTGFIGGLGTSRWQIYHPESESSSDNALNLRPIGDAKVRFNIHQDGDLDFVKTTHLDLNELEWQLFRVDLDNQPSVFVGSIPAWQLELVCNVPSLESSITRSEAAHRILDDQRSKNRWQRQIVKKNRESIAMFFNKQQTFFANPVIIHDPESKFIQYDTDESDGVTNASISLKFLKDNRSIKLIDGKKRDSRPLTIIDGQHRIRGASLAPDNYDQRLLVVLLPPEISESTAGRLFAEINTLSKPLKDKHRMFLAHRFQVSSPDPMYSFARFDPNDGKTFRDRANRMSYEFAARLSKDDVCPFLEGRIRFLDQNTPTLMDISKWVEFTFGWFQNYPYTEVNSFSEDQILSELCNYFDAWHEIIGEENWKGDDGCLFRTATQFRVILKRFDQIYQAARSSSPSSEPISKDRFREVLLPLENIPFTNRDVFDAYDGSGETPWKLLDAWIHDAIAHQSRSSEDDILDEDLRGVPGAGILSAPPESQTHQVDLPPGGIYPSDKKTKYLTAHRPNNCGFKCSVRVGFEDSIFKKVSFESKNIERRERIPVRSTREIENIRSGLYIELEWETISSKVVNRIEIN